MSEPEFSAGWAGNVSRRQFVRGALGTLLLAGILPARGTGPMTQGREESWVEQVHAIATAILSYSLDNAGSYPDGKSSTELFQKLIDGRYVGDPGTFFVSLVPNKTRASSAKLTPENVCFDVTGGADMDMPDTVPLVYLTGFKVDYKAGSAVSLLTPPMPGIAAAFKNNAARFFKGGADGSVANFIPSGLPAGKYRQLMP